MNGIDNIRSVQLPRHRHLRFKSKERKRGGEREKMEFWFDCEWAQRATIKIVYAVAKWVCNLHGSLGSSVFDAYSTIKVILWSIGFVYCTLLYIGQYRAEQQYSPRKKFSAENRFVWLLFNHKCRTNGIVNIVLMRLATPQLIGTQHNAKVRQSQNVMIRVTIKTRGMDSKCAPLFPWRVDYDCCLFAIENSVPLAAVVHCLELCHSKCETLFGF